MCPFECKTDRGGFIWTRKQLRDGPCCLDNVGIVLSGNIGAHKCDVPCLSKYYLKEERVGKDLAPVHVEAFEQDSKLTDRSLQTLIKFGC